MGDGTNFGTTTTEPTAEEAKGLRAKLEEVLATSKAQATELNTYKAKDFLAEKGISLVAAEELAAIDPSKWEDEAPKLLEAKRKQEEDVLRGVLERQGLTGDDLEDTLAQMIGGEPTKDETQAAQTRDVRDLGSLAGSPVLRVDTSKLEGVDAMRAGFAQNAKRQAARRRT